MKVTIEIDCTPAEARQFMGLPDLQPMQDRLLEEMEGRLRERAFKPVGIDYAAVAADLSSSFAGRKPA
jgi:hypothetical protein